MKGHTLCYSFHIYKKNKLQYNKEYRAKALNDLLNYNICRKVGKKHAENKRKE